MNRDVRGRFAPISDPELAAIQSFLFWGRSASPESILRALNYLVSRLLGRDHYITNR